MFSLQLSTLLVQKFALFPLLLKQVLIQCRSNILSQVHYLASALRFDINNCVARAWLLSAAVLTRRLL